MSIYQKIEKLCHTRGITITDMCREASIPRSIFTELKKGRAKSLSSKTLAKLSAYFSLPVEHFIDSNYPTITEIATAGDVLSDGVTPPHASEIVHISPPAFKKFIASTQIIPDNEQSNLIPLSPYNIYSIPVVESVSAGFGALAIDDVIDYIPLYITSSAEADETICIKVKGDSMYPKIENGDIIQVHKQTDVDSGSIAVIRLENEEFLVKKVQFGHNWIELHSINPTYPPLRFEGPAALGVHIVGLVKKIIKNV